MTMSRRELLLRSSFTVGAGALLIRTAVGAMADATVETANGKVRGRSIAGIHSFLGLRYGASTEGRNRFMPPQKAAAMDGDSGRLLLRQQRAAKQSRASRPGPGAQRHRTVDRWHRDSARLKVKTACS